MSTQQLSETPGLGNLPCEIHLEIFSYLRQMGGAHGFVFACQRLYHTFIIEFYKENGPQLNWLPLLIGISEGNIDMLDKCLKAGAPLNHPWPYLGEFGMSSHPDFFRCCQPLDLATWYGQDDVLEWLAERGAVATDGERFHLIELGTTDYFVSDAMTVEGRWKPVMYQQETRLEETYPLLPYPHFVWYSPELKPTDVLSRLLRLYNSHHGNRIYFEENNYLPDSESRSHLASCIQWIWVDMLLSASDPALILESAFVKGPGFFGQTEMTEATVAERLRFKFSADMFGQKSLLNSVAPLSIHPFSKHVSLRAPEVFSHLLNSGAEADSISWPYFIILTYLFRFESSRLDVFPTFELYPLLYDAMIECTASRIDYFREDVLKSVHETLRNLRDWEANLNKMVLKAHDSGVRLCYIANAFGVRHEFDGPPLHAISVPSRNQTYEGPLHPVSQAVLSILEAIRDGKL